MLDGPDRRRRPHRRLPGRADDADPLEGAGGRTPTAGFATTFLRQMEEVLGTCLDRGVKVVSNAGGLNPTAWPTGSASWPADLGLSPRIAVVRGRRPHATGSTDLQAAGEELTAPRHRPALADAGVEPVTANAYLGGLGIAAALAPAPTWSSPAGSPTRRWSLGRRRGGTGGSPPTSDALAGAVVAGHVIECGPQATGGNYSFADEDLPDLRYPGFPIAEVAGDGSSVITKQPGTGGAVTVGTVTAQLLYEIAGPALRQPRRGRPLRHRRARSAGAGPGADLRCPGRGTTRPTKVALELPGRLAEHDGDGAHRARQRGQGGACRATCSSTCSEA